MILGKIAFCTPQVFALKKNSFVLNRVNITFLFFSDLFHVKPVKSSWPINQSNQLCHWLLGNGRLNPLHLTPSIWHSHPSFWRFHLWMIQNPLCWESNKAFSKHLFPPQINSKWKLISILLLLFGVALANMYTIICKAHFAPQFMKFPPPFWIDIPRANVLRFSAGENAKEICVCYTTVFAFAFWKKASIK